MKVELQFEKCKNCGHEIEKTIFGAYAHKDNWTGNECLEPECDCLDPLP